MPEDRDLFQLVNTAQKILIIIKKALSFSDINNLNSLVQLLKSKNIQYQILSIDKQLGDIQNECKKIGIEITSELKPSEYVVTIDYASSGVEKVVYDTDKEKGKLIFKILPSKSGFSFDKVQFEEGSGKFQATVLIGTDNPKDLGKFYDDNEYLFKEIGYIKFNQTNEIVDEILRSHEVLSPDYTDQLMDNILKDINIVEGILEHSQIERISSIINLGGNFSKSLISKYYSKNIKYLELYKYLLNSYRTQDEVIYAIVKKEHLKDFTFEDIKNFGRIPFNIVEKYKLALVLFELSDDRMYLVVESNDSQKYSASTIAGVFDGVGDSGHAYCKIDDMRYEDIDKRFWSILKDLYHIEIKSQSDSKNVDNTPKVLTKRHKNSKLDS